MPVQEVIASVDECYRCGYDLRGIASDQPWPECGLLAECSRRVSDELHNTRPRWLRKLSLGVLLMLLGIGFPIIWPAMAAAVLQWVQPNYAFSRTALDLLWESLPFVGIDLGAILILLGTLLITTAEGYSPSDQGDYRRRVGIRVCAGVMMIGVLTDHLMLIRLIRAQYVGGNERYELVSFVLPLVTLLASVPLPVLLFAQLRGLAKRARSAHLAEHCMIVGIGASVALVYSAVVFCIMNYADQWFGSYWASRSSTWMILMALMGCAGMLFVLWSLYLLIRFAIAFWKASRQLRRKWRQDDRASAV